MDFLILGNGPHLTLTDWDKVRDSTLNTIGINRSYLLYDEHQTLHIQDPIVILEMFDSGYSDEELACLNIQTTRYFIKRMGIERRRKKITVAEFNRLRSLIKENIIFVNNEAAFSTNSPFSIVLAISTIIKKTRKEHPSRRLKFYITGVELKYSKTNNHFWHGKYPSAVRLKGAGGSNKRQLFQQYISFRRMRSLQKPHNFEIISCTPSSRLNNLFNTEQLNTVLGRFAKRK